MGSVALGSGGLRRDGEGLSQEVFCCRSVTAVQRKDALCIDSQLWITQSSRLFFPPSPNIHPSGTQGRADLPFSG